MKDGNETPKVEKTKAPKLVDTKDITAETETPESNEGEVVEQTVASTEATEPAKKERKPRESKLETKNGVARPKEGTKTGLIWAISDGLANHFGRVPARAEVLHAAEEEGIATSTAATQYGRWRKFNGVTGTVKVPVQTEESANEEPEVATVVNG